MPPEKLSIDWIQAEKIKSYITEYRSSNWENNQLNLVQKKQKNGLYSMYESYNLQAVKSSNQLDESHTSCGERMLTKITGDTGNESFFQDDPDIILVFDTR